MMKPLTSELRAICLEIEARMNSHSFGTNEIADAAGIGRGTARNLFNHVTRWPRFQTVALLALAVGLPAVQLQRVKPALAPKPAKTRKYKKRRKPKLRLRAG